MANYNKNIKSNSVKSPVDEERIKPKFTGDSIKKFFAHPAISAAIGGIFVLMFQSVVVFTKTYRAVPDQIKEIENSVNDISNSIPQMIAAIEELQTIHANSGNVIRKELSDIPIAAITLESDGVLAEYIRSQEFTSKMEVNLSTPSWNPEEIVAVGSDGTEYKAYELYNTRVVFSYEENGRDIIFSGQINEKNHWDGRCLFNVYENDSFIIATEANYDDGERLYYEQLFSEDDEWIYSERYTNEGNNSGDTWKYQKSEGVVRQVDISEPSEGDMIVPREFIIPLAQRKTGHYHGDTSGGEYNDDTGEAYFISYDTNGYVRTVYKGKFSGGDFEDNTGKAWYITRESKTNQDLNYQYYKGEFKSGHPVPEDERSASSIFDEKITIDEANRIIAGETFQNEVKWNESKFYYDNQDSE